MERDAAYWEEYARLHPCVGCSHCCRTAPCAVAFREFGPIRKCPALKYHDGRWWCGVIEQAQGDKKTALIQDMAIGAGCSSTLFNQDRICIPTPKQVGYDQD